MSVTIANMNVSKEGIANMTSRVYNTIIKEDEHGEFYLELPAELLEYAGWAIGDTIVWKDNKDGTWTLTKKEKDD